MQVFIQYDRDDKRSENKGADLSHRFAIETRAELPLQCAIVFDVHSSQLHQLQSEISAEVENGMKLKLGIPE